MKLRCRVLMVHKDYIVIICKLKSIEYSVNNNKYVKIYTYICKTIEIKKVPTIIMEKTIKYISIFIIISLFSLPQLNNLHYEPSATMWGQITCGFIVMLLFVWLCFIEKQLLIPKLVILALILILFLLIHSQLFKTDFIGEYYIFIFEIILLIFFAISVKTLAKVYGEESLVIYFAFAIIISAVFQSIIAIIQYSGFYKYCGNIIFYDSDYPNTNIFGHFGQRNHLCHLLSWASFAVIYLYCKDKLKLFLSFLLIALFVFVMTIGASRSVFLYFIVSSLVSVIFYSLNYQDRKLRQISLLIVITTIMLIGFEYLFPLIHKLNSNKSASGLVRVLSASNSGEFGRRMVEWSKAWYLFTHNIILGTGLGSFAKNSVWLSYLYPHAPVNSGLFINCHNFILQFLAEIGIIGTLLIVTIFAIAIKYLFRHVTIDKLFLLCCICTTIIHSMLEYPLWYFYFLVPFIGFISLYLPAYRLVNQSIKLILLGIVLSLAILLSLEAYKYNKLVALYDVSDDKAEYIAAVQQLKQLYRDDILLRYLTMKDMINYINIDNKQTNEVFESNELYIYVNHFTNYVPFPTNLIKLAKLEWQRGSYDRAYELVKIAIISYPVYKRSMLYSLHQKRYKKLYNFMNNYKIDKGIKNGL
jgi:O-antigen ligase